MRRVMNEAPIGPYGLTGVLATPERPAGLVIFAHGSGSSRLSPRNVYVAQRLHGKGFATLLFDLLTPAEAADRRNVFDLPLLAERVRHAVAWARKNKRVQALRIGLFGASTGAGAAMMAAAALPDEISAVVSRGGRPDLAGAALGLVHAPTLLIVGALDLDVLRLNEAAKDAMHCPTEIAIVPGAGHLFEEAGALEQVIALAGDWFSTHLKGAGNERAVS
jgi:putative phosphoribosyl transferase